MCAGMLPKAPNLELTDSPTYGLKHAMHHQKHIRGTWDEGGTQVQVRRLNETI